MVSGSVEWRCESPVELLITTHIRSFLSRFCALAEGFVLPLENRTKDHLPTIALANLFCLGSENHHSEPSSLKAEARMCGFQALEV